MSKSRFLVVLLAIMVLPSAMYADIRDYLHRFELGVSAGVGFFVGPRYPIAGNEAVYRIHSYDGWHLNQYYDNTFGWPGVETFGGSLGYRFDTRWTLRAQATAQRLHYIEWNEDLSNPNKMYTYYNPLCHLDVVAEYNILNYTNMMQPGADMYNVVPYVGLGIGMTFFNEEASIRSAVNGGSNLKNSTTYPLVGGVNQLTGKKANLGIAAYIPVILGVKWRINDYLQLKTACQYQLYVTPYNVEGGCPIGGEIVQGVDVLNKHDNTYYQIDLNATGRPTYEQLSDDICHNFLFSLSLIVNMDQWYEDRLITY